MSNLRELFSPDQFLSSRNRPLDEVLAEADQIRNEVSKMTREELSELRRKGEAHVAALIDSLRQAKAANKSSGHFLEHCQSKPLTFGELNCGDKFIAFPSDGDDDGHGGFRKGDWLFQKMHGACRGDDGANVIRLADGCLLQWSDSSPVLKVM